MITNPDRTALFERLRNDPTATPFGSIRNGQIDSASLRDLSVVTAKIQDAAITTAKIGTAVITSATIADAAITTAKIANLAVEEAKIAALAVTEAKIGAAAITSAKIQDAAIVTAKINDLAVTNAKINSLAVSKLTAGTIGVNQIYVGEDRMHIDGVNARIDIADGTGQVRARLGKLASGAYGLRLWKADGTQMIDENTGVKTAGLEDSAVTNVKVGALAVTAGKIDADAVTNSKIINDAVTTAKVNNLAVTTGKINDLGITNGKIDTNTIQNGKLLTDTLQYSKQRYNGAAYKRTTTQAISTATWEELSLTTVESDEDGWKQTGTQHFGLVKYPAGGDDGVYVLCATVEWQQNGTGERKIEWCYSTTEGGTLVSIASDVRPAIGGDQTSQTLTWVGPLDPNNGNAVVWARVRQNSGGALNVLAGAQSHRATISYLGAAIGA